MKKSLLFVMILICLVACKNIVTYNKKSTITINIDSIPHHNYSDSIYVKNLEKIPLQTDRNCLIGNIDKLEVMMDKIWIMDKKITKQIFVFDLNGKFERTIGKIGKGPGEYTHYLEDFFVDSLKKEVGLMGAYGMLNIYDLNGNYKKTHNFKKYYPVQIIPIKDSYLLRVNISSQELINNRKVYKMCLTDSKFKVKKYFFEQDKFESIYRDSGEKLYSNGLDIYFRKNFCDTIYKFNQYNEFVPFLTIAGNKNIINKKVYFDDYAKAKEKNGLHSIFYITGNNISMNYMKNGKQFEVVYSFTSGESYIQEEYNPLLPVPYIPITTYKNNVYGFIDILSLKAFYSEVIERANELDCKKEIIEIIKESLQEQSLSNNPIILKYFSADSKS